MAGVDAEGRHVVPSCDLYYCPVVGTIGDSMRWASHFLAVLERHIGSVIVLAIANSVADLTLSTCFSGIGGAEVALGSIIAALYAYQGMSTAWAPTFMEVSIPVVEWMRASPQRNHHPIEAATCSFD